MDQFKQIELAKISYLKNAGNVLIMSEELGLTLEDTQKIIEQFREKEEKDVAELIANNLMRFIMVGSATRKLHLMEMLHSLEMTEKPRLSVCCNSPVRILNESEGTFTCLKCFTSNCQTIKAPKASIYNIKLSIVEQLRAEDETLVEMAEKMGYTNKVEGPSTVIQQKNNYLVVGGTSNNSNDPIIQDIKRMHPMDREKLIEKLRKEIVSLNGQLEPKPE